MTFELLVATRYLRAKRKQAMISVITVIAILGVSAGVAALVVAMAVSEGQRQDIRDRLLGAQGHVTIYATGKEAIPNYLEVAKQIEKVEDVIGAAPRAEQGMAISSTLTGVRVIGIIPEMDSRVSLLSRSLIGGNLADLKGNTIAIGKELHERQGLNIGDHVKIVSIAGTGGPSGMERKSLSFTVVAIFSIGLYEYDASLVYVPFDAASYLIDAGDVATNIEVKVRDKDIDRSEEVGKAILNKIGSTGFEFQDWKVTHKSIFQALKLERLAMMIAIGLIVFVASLNIIATLTMMVLDKTRDIATLMAMGATLSQIRFIFILQGVIIGCIGTILGLALGNGLSYFADRYHLIPLNPEVYSIAYLPFRADLWDSGMIAAAAILISFLATLYPSAAAAKLQPVEALRYE